MSGYAYLHNAAAQDQLAWRILGGYFDQYGASGAAAMWYSGQPDPTKTYGNPPVWRYVADVLALMNQNLPAPNYQGTGGGPYAYTLPPPNEGDWSGYVSASADIHNTAAGNLAAYTSIIASLF
jgi:hypothetical protein